MGNPFAKEYNREQFNKDFDEVCHIPRAERDKQWQELFAKVDADPASFTIKQVPEYVPSTEETPCS